MSPPALACEGLGRAFGAVRAVDELSFAVERGEILGVLGPSGCGKTTLLRLIAGLERPDKGEIRIDGVMVAGPGRMLPPERRRVGMVFQHYALFPHLSVAENIAYGLPASPERGRQVADALARVGLGALGGRMPHALSGGQQQRVALARALAPRPAILLLDEPFSNLDARLRQVVREEVREILKAARMTAVFVTHDQEEALFVGDRIAVLNGGRLEQIDRPEAIYHRPATRFVAEFMGHTQFLPGSVAGDAIETALGPIPQATGLPPGTAVELLIRPDDLRIAPIPPSPGPPANLPSGLGPAAAGPPGARGTVLRRTFLGMHQLYRVELPSGLALDCLAPHPLLIEDGAPVCVWVDAGHPLGLFREGRALPAED